MIIIAGVLQSSLAASSICKNDTGWIVQLPFPCSSKEADLSLCFTMLLSHPTPFPYPSVLPSVTWYLWELRWPSCRQSFQRGCWKAKSLEIALSRQGTVILATLCFQDGWGKGHQDYFSVTKILLKQFLRVGVWFWVFWCCCAIPVLSVFHVQLFHRRFISAAVQCQRLYFLVKYIRCFNDDKDELSKVKGLLSQTG